LDGRGGEQGFGDSVAQSIQVVMRLPSIHPLKANQALGRDGWIDDHQQGGYHIKYKEGHPNPISVPYHGSRPLKRGTLRNIIRAACLTPEQFLQLLRKKR